MASCITALAHKRIADSAALGKNTTPFFDFAINKSFMLLYEVMHLHLANQVCLAEDLPFVLYALRAISVQLHINLESALCSFCSSFVQLWDAKHELLSEVPFNEEQKSLLAEYLSSLLRASFFNGLFLFSCYLYA